MIFGASFCDPFKPTIIELGDIHKDQIISTFKSYDWQTLLKAKEGVKDDEIHFSPSFEAENKENLNGFVISAIEYKVWYLFFKRPKMVKTRRWFKTEEKLVPEYTSHTETKSFEEVLQYLTAFINSDYAYLEKNIP